MLETLKVIPTAAMSDTGSMSKENALTTNSTGIGLLRTRARSLFVVRMATEEKTEKTRNVWNIFAYMSEIFITYL